MGKISFPKFKSHVGLFSDVGGALGFLSAVKALFFSEWTTLWAFTLQLNWVVGTIAFWVLFGWLVLLLLIWDSLWSVWRWLDWRFMEWSGRKYLGGTNIPIPKSDIRWTGFVVAGVLLLASGLASLITGGMERQKGEKLHGNIMVWLYLVAALIVGVYFGLTVKPETVSGFPGWLIRPLGWIILPLLIFLMCVLVVKVWKLLFSLIFVTEETDKDAKG